jgi:AcrR family transcriptional regulator
MANFTEKEIKASFMKLLNERPLNKITIKDIASDCGINRNSFYYHFQDIPSLLEALIKEETDKIIEQHPTISSFKDCLNIAIEFALKNKRAVYHIYNSINRDIFERYLWRQCEYVITTYINTVFPDIKMSEKDKKYIITFYKCEIFGEVSAWLSDGMNDDISEYVNRMCYLRDGMTEELLNRCKIK